MKKENKVSQNAIRPKHDLILKPKISVGMRELGHLARREEEKEKERREEENKEKGRRKSGMELFVWNFVRNCMEFVWDLYRNCLEFLELFLLEFLFGNSL